MIFPTIVSAVDAESTVPAASLFSNSSMTPLLVLLIFMLGMWFVANRNQKKREKDANDLKKNLEIGDEITTIGGIVGIVVGIKDDVITLETGSDRSKLRIAKWAIQTNETAIERAASKKAQEKKKS